MNYTSHHPTPTPHPFFPTDIPTLPKLLDLKVVTHVGAKYSIFGTYLLMDNTGTIVEALEKEHRGNADDINMAILRRWLQGKGLVPVTWSTLVDVLKKILM